MTELPEFAFTIDGNRVGSKRRTTVFDPSTGRPLVEVPLADANDADKAVAAAERAFRDWSRQSTDARRKTIAAFAGAIDAHLDELARISTLEQGRPLDKARSEILGARAYLNKFLELDLEPSLLRESPSGTVVLGRKPLGVVAAITAWNAPVLLAIWKIIPALLAGNTVVVKPSPYAPLTTLYLAELARTIFPPGVLNAICGGAEAGGRLVAHPDVRKIAFTGSAETGRHIAIGAAATFKRVTLELGGNDAAIVLDDADPKSIAQALFWGKFHNSGQICASVKRLFVHRRIFAEMVDCLVAIARGVKIGSGFDAGVQMGPVQNKPQYERLRRQRECALREGFELRYESGVPVGDGYFFPITLLTGETGDNLFQREEAFGPLLPIFPFDDDEAALHQANATMFGLGGSVWSTDFECARALAERLEVGTAWVNQHPAMAPDLPFGGIKHSGIGVEGGELGLREYSSVHVLNTRRA